MSRAPLALILAAALLAGGCAPPARPATPPDLAGWHVLYERPGWAGEPAADLRIAGDVMLGRHVAEIAERQGPAYPFAGAGELLAGDLTLVNLESPLTERRDAVRPGPYRLIAPPALAVALAGAGVDAAGLANNHALDAGPAGLADALAALRAAGVAPVGAGTDEAAALAPAILEAGGLRVAVLALNDVADPADASGGLADRGDARWRNPDFLIPDCRLSARGEAHRGGSADYADYADVADGVDGVCAGRAWLSEAALDAVAAARSSADVVVVLPHWGAEYAAEPSARQRAWAEALVAAGADVVAGAHPHVLQRAEPVSAGGRAGFVAYSLGNFVFDAPDDPALSGGAVLRALVDREGVALVAAAPVATAGGRPRPLDLDGADGRAAVGRLTPGEATEAGPAQPPGPRADHPQMTPISGPSGRGIARESVKSVDDSVRLGPGVAAEDGGGDASAWRWDGAQAVPAAPPAGPPPPALTRLPADLRGDGEPVWAELDAAGVVTVRGGPGAGAPPLWRNEDPAWRFTRIAAGDPNDDGRVELLMVLWQRDAAGDLRTQPYLLGWRGGRYRVIWGGSATPAPIQDVALADLDADGRVELVVLEGGAAPGDAGEHVSVWRWHGWGFQLEWRSEPGSWSRVALLDTDGDGGAEIAVWP